MDYAEAGLNSKLEPITQKKKTRKPKPKFDFETNHSIYDTVGVTPKLSLQGGVKKRMKDDMQSRYTKLVN